MMTPSISLVVPLYNKRDFVLDAVQSALAQTLQPLEIIVVDDGSTDGGAESLHGCAERLTVLSQPNAGVAAARNAGVRRACGDVVCFLDADDILFPDHLARIASLAQDYPQATMLGTSYYRLLPDGRRLPPRRAAVPRRRGLLANFFDAWSRGPFMFTSAIGVRRSALQSITFPIGERLGEDQDVWFRLAEAGPVAYDPQPTVLYRVGLQESATSHEGPRMEPLPAYVRLANRLERGEIPTSLRTGAKRLIAQHHLNVADVRLRAGDLAGAGALMASGPASTQVRRYASLRMRMLAMRFCVKDHPA